MCVIVLCSGKMDAIYECPNCTKRFLNQSNLSRHNRNIECGGEITIHKHLCPFGDCKYTTKYLSNLHTHGEHSHCELLKEFKEILAKQAKVRRLTSSQMPTAAATSSAISISQDSANRKIFVPVKHFDYHLRSRHTSIPTVEESQKEQFNSKLFPSSYNELVSSSNPSNTSQRPLKVSKATLPGKRKRSEQIVIDKSVKNIAIPEAARTASSITGRNQPHFFEIKTNRTVKPATFRNSKKKFDENKCGCMQTDENPCGPSNQCINYERSVECDNNCTAGNKRQNQRFAIRSYSKVQRKHFGAIGWGLIAAENIERNTFIIEYVGEVINSEQFDRRFNEAVKNKVSNFYFLQLKDGLYIDSAKYGNNSRFINHSCEPNCAPRKYIVKGQTRIGFFAKVKIPKVSFYH